MNKHEKSAIIRSLEMFIEENGEIWYSYADSEQGTTVDLIHLLEKVKGEK